MAIGRVLVPVLSGLKVFWAEFQDLNIITHWFFYWEAHGSIKGEWNMTKVENLNSPQDIAQSEASVWEESPYYEDAEEWTWLFWSPEHPFRVLFDQLDLTDVLELACGHGRHAQFALENFPDKIASMTIMDVLESNIEYCKSRLSAHNKVSILANNGADFQPVKDSSLTAIFCYDAMVHFNHEVVKSYLQDTFRVLRVGGGALFHHSNYSSDPKRHFGQNPHARAFLSAEIFKEYAVKSGLKVCEQFIMPWGGGKGKVENLDCISLVVKPIEV